MISEYLKSLKTKGNLTNQQIAEMSGVSAATIQRMLTEKGESSYETVAKVVYALGGSMDEMAGIKREDPEYVQFLKTENEMYQNQIASYERLISSYDGVFAEKDKASAYLKKIIRYLAIALSTLGIVFVGIVIFDILNGGVGYIRYDELSRPIQDGMNVLLSALPDWLGLR